MPSIKRPITLDVITGVSHAFQQVIGSFKDAEAQRLFRGEPARRLPPDLRRVAQRKLSLVEAAVELRDLRAPPGNRLEALVGDRWGQHSIRINDQWRICFRWEKDTAYDIEIVDYH